MAVTRLIAGNWRVKSDRVKMWQQLGKLRGREVRYRIVSDADPHVFICVNTTISASANVIHEISSLLALARAAKLRKEDQC